MQRDEHQRCEQQSRALDRLGGENGMGEWTRDSMESGVSNADVIIAVISPAYIKSKNCGFEMELAADEALGPLSSSEFLPLYDSDFLPEVALAEHRDCEGVAMCLRRGADLERSPTDVMSTFSSMGEELRALQRGKLQRDMSDCCVGRTPPVL